MRKKIMNCSDFVLNEVEIQNAEQAIELISKQTEKKDKAILIKDISKGYFSKELIEGQKTLNLNDRNQDIAVIQSILIGLGYLKNHAADGTLDTSTIESVRSIIKDFNMPISVDTSIPLSFIKFLLEFEIEKEEPEQVKGIVMKDQKIPSVVVPTAPLSIQLPQSSVSKGEDVKRGVDYPTEELEKYAQKSIHYSLSKDGGKNLSPNFKVSDFACKDNSDVVLINPHLIELLEKIQQHFGKDVQINSGYRTPSYNAGLRSRSKSKGVAKNSQHMYGNAADIVIKGVTPTEIYNFVDTFHQGGMGLYLKNNFVHVDVRDTVGLQRSRW
jgi:uncharacterized protein YcbK (DUF882 family)